MQDAARPWFSAWAKSAVDPPGSDNLVGWLPLHVHLADTAAVMGLLIDEWVPRHVIDVIARDLGGDERDARVLLTWLAAVHDVGKISPAFAAQVPALTLSMSSHGLVVGRGVRENRDRPKARHERVGEIAVREWLGSELGFERTTARQIASVVGAHHGVPPTHSQLTAVRGRPDLAGRGSWQQGRGDALSWATDLVGGREVLAGLGRVSLSTPAQVLCSGLVIMADWIASDERLFDRWPLSPVDAALTTPDDATTAARVKAAWSRVNLPPPWRPAPMEDPRAAFAARFGRTPESARPSQIAAVETAICQDEPGLVVVEAPMGEGKTEAALLAAEALAARTGADGCFVALPTRATTDAMFSRVRRWMRSLPDLPAEVSVLLAHSASALNEEYLGLVRDSRITGVGTDGERPSGEVGVAHQWLSGRRRGALAQFVVGTVDQVLFTALRSRHLMLRHLGLAGKVVIIDEVHAYDVYMSRYLDRALHWLGAYGTPVVLLSATLPAARRAELVRAYESGAGTTSAPDPAPAGYPMITATGAARRVTPAGSPPRTIRVTRLPQTSDDGDPADLDALVELLREALSGGGCAVVVRNTVARVQATADRLVAEFGEDDVTVAHSRFLAVDRARLDADLLRRFGPPGPDTDRPARHVVVASQVVEQSLDVDFDLMVTDLAPVDLVLQRVGRLHRHDRDRPDRLRTAGLVLTGVEDWAAEPVRSVPGSRRVYGEHTLLRCAALLHQCGDITVPDDIAPLVQAAYGEDRLGPPSWQPHMDRARSADAAAADRRRERAERFLLGTTGRDDDTMSDWLQAGVGDAESEGDTRFTGQVRDGAESLEVVVVQADRDQGLLVPSWVPGGGAQIPLHDPVPARIARRIAGCVLRLPVGMSQLDDVGDGVVAALERNHWTSFDQTPLLKGQLVLVLDEHRDAELRHGAAHFRIHYDLQRGLLTERVRSDG